MSPRKAASRVIPAGPRVNPPKPRSYEPPAMPVAQNPFVQIAKRKAVGEQRLAAAQRAAQAGHAATPLLIAARRRST
jgi:hypothetical protein